MVVVACLGGEGKEMTAVTMLACNLLYTFVRRLHRRKSSGAAQATYFSESLR